MAINLDDTIQVDEIPAGSLRGRGRTISIPAFRLTEMGITDGDRIGLYVDPDRPDVLILIKVDSE